jgi:hypothetical protein
LDRGFRVEHVKMEIKIRVRKIDSNISKCKGRKKVSGLAFEFSLG